MDFTINSNTPQLNTLRQLASTYRRLQKDGEKLASGRRINAADDDPVGLVVSEKMRAQIASLEQEIENTEATMDKYRVGDGTLGELQGMLTRMRTLAIANLNAGAVGEDAQSANQAEFSNLVRTFNDAASSAEYNGAPLLDGADRAVAEIEELSERDISTTAGAEEAITALDSATAELGAARGEVGAKIADDLEHTRASLEVTLANLGAAESGIRDADTAREHANLVRDLLLQQTATASLAHGHQAEQAVLSLL